MRGVLSLLVALAAFGCGATFFEFTCNDRPAGFVFRATMTSAEGGKPCSSDSIS
jgi:hypothetical protein